MTTTRVGVFQPNQPAETAPAYFIPRDHARQLRNQGLGTFINRAKGFRLTKAANVPELRGESARMNARTSEKLIDAVMGGEYGKQKWAENVLAGWDPKQRPAYEYPKVEVTA